MNAMFDSTLATLAAMFSGLGVVMYYWRKADVENIKQLRSEIEDLRAKQAEQESRHEQQLADMYARARSRDEQIDFLDRWRLTARVYIAVLRGIAADRGIETPDPPEVLQLSLPVPDHTPDHD